MIDVFYKENECCLCFFKDALKKFGNVSFIWDDATKWNIFSAPLALYEGNSPVTSEFPSLRPVTRSFGVFFDQCLNKRLSTQSRRRWFETSSHSFWRLCNDCETCGIGPHVKHLLGVHLFLGMQNRKTSAAGCNQFAHWVKIDALCLSHFGCIICGFGCQKQVSQAWMIIASHGIQWDAITYACLRYLLMPCSRSIPTKHCWKDTQHLEWNEFNLIRWLLLISSIATISIPVYFTTCKFENVTVIWTTDCNTFTTTLKSLI